MASSKVPSPRLRKRRSPAVAGVVLGRDVIRFQGRKRAALDEIDVKPAVAIVVEQADAPAHRLGNLASGGRAVVEAETEPGDLGVVGEDRWGRERLCGWAARA